MRNEAAICRIHSICCSYCTCPLSTSCCYISFTFDSCGVFFITNIWLKWCNHNCRFSAIWTGNVFPYCWSKRTGICIHRVSYSLLNYIIAVSEVFNLILSWDLDHCRSRRNYHCRFFMRNKTAICRINCVGGSYCTCSWGTSCCYISFTFSSRGIFLITDTWLKWCNDNFRFSTVSLEDFCCLCWS
ncbi:hypothetical protein D8842_06020 [Streptococcus mitis]|nr:hypothetical protein D8842_06020 [Streptococcus mitis]